jgi:hypothetical protein
MVDTHRAPHRLSASLGSRTVSWRSGHLFSQTKHELELDFMDKLGLTEGGNRAMKGMSFYLRRYRVQEEEKSS